MSAASERRDLARRYAGGDPFGPLTIFAETGRVVSGAGADAEHAARYYTEDRPEDRDPLLALRDYFVEREPVDLDEDEDEYDPERDDFEDETDTPEDYEGDRYLS